MKQSTQEEMERHRTKIALNEGINVIEGCEISPDHIKKVRLINFLEPFIVYGIILGTVWGTMLDESNPWLYIILAPLLVWILVISPWWHYEKLNEKEIFLPPEKRNLGFWMLEARGLGSPKKYFMKDENGVRGFIKHKDAVIRMVVLWDILIMALPYAFEKEFRDITIQIFGASSTLLQIAAVILIIIVADILMVFVLFPIMMRLDNFVEGWNNQLKTSLMIGIPLVFIFNLFFQIFWPQLLATFGTEGAFAMKGDDPFTRVDMLNIMDLGGQIAGYIAWGFLQQLLFLSIFSTQFSRAFDLINDKWGIYKASFFSALFFGLIHLPNFWLSILTWLAGYVWAVLFMQNRNLLIMGISHGTLGSLGNKLLPISYNVGPGSV